MCTAPHCTVCYTSLYCVLHLTACATQVTSGEALLEAGYPAIHTVGRASYRPPLLVDIRLPPRDGLSLVRELRQQGRTTPVIMLSARGEVEQRVEGLNAGADDYLPKPFAMSELLARLRSLLRRNVALKPAVLTLADLTYDVGTRETRRAGKRIELSSRESLLLECLLRAEGRVVSRRDIILSVWEYDFDPGSNLVDVYVRRLREKIDRDHAPVLIQTVRGLGYALRIQP